MNENDRLHQTRVEGLLLVVKDGSGTHADPYEIKPAVSIQFVLEDLSNLSRIRGMPIYFFFQSCEINVDKEVHVEPADLNDEKSVSVAAMANEEAAKIIARRTGDQEKPSDKNAEAERSFVKELFQKLKRLLRQ